LDRLSEEGAYNELQGYTLTLRDPAFIHQHVVDAWMAQHADETTKPIGLAFALIGLYLHLEKGLTGREVQLAHMALGRSRKEWPRFTLPSDRGSLTAADVMEKPPGLERRRAIDDWASSVWSAFGDSHGAVAGLVKEYEAEIRR